MSDSASKPDPPLPAKQPSRRRFQFRLRTLLAVITLLCIVFAWIGAQVRTVQGRMAALERFHCRYTYVETDGTVVIWRSPDDPHVRATAEMPERYFPKAHIPVVRCWLGDRAVAVFYSSVESTSPAERSQLEALFPEAEWVVLKNEELFFLFQGH